MTRYSRQTILPEVGASGQARLAAARILVVGAGGLGSALLPVLAGAGVGALNIFDHDRVALSNLHRQTLYCMADIGKPKARVAASALRALNPDCKVTARVTRLTPSIARQELRDVDLVVDAADAFAVTYALSDLCLAMGKPLISASVLGRSGYVGGFCGGAPSYRAVFPDLPPAPGTCATAGVMGPAVATLGALQAQMVLAVLLGHAPSPLGKLLRFDLTEWRVTTILLTAAPEPARPSPAILSVKDVRRDDLVIDLRPTTEAPEPAHPNALRVDPGTLAPAPGQRVVFACSTGLRAWRAARALELRCGNTVAILAAET